MRLAAAFFVGLVFGTGIAFSGMANPAKVLNFFDLAGSWDPSLAFVMGGALLVAAVGDPLALRRDAPFLAPSFQVPTGRQIDLRLLAGSAVFGIGWGIAGFCPGGALPALGTGKAEVFVFTGALVAGVLATRLATRLPRTATAE